MDQILLRPVEFSDIKNIFELSNSPFARSNSINNKPILWSEHVEWFNNELQNKQNYFYIIETQHKQFAGQLRLKFIQPHEYLISISILKEFQNQHIGTMSFQKLIAMHTNDNFIAYIKSDNMLSLAFFKKNGFHQENQVELNNNIFYIFKRKIKLDQSILT